MSTPREALESPVVQGEDERIARSLDVGAWGSDPTDIGVVVKDQDGQDVSGAVTTGTPSVTGDVITLPVIHSLTAGQEYRVEVKFTVSSGQVLECFFIIRAEE